MADIVLIAEGTYKEGSNSIGDVVAIHEDGIVGGGVGYENFTVVNVPGTRAEVEALLNAKIPKQKRCFKSEVEALLNAKIPKQKRCFKSKADVGEWIDEPPEEAGFWYDTDAESWKKIEKHPKYQINISLDTELDEAIKDKVLTDTYKISLLATKASSNLVTDKINQVVTSITLASDREESKS